MSHLLSRTRRLRAARGAGIAMARISLEFDPFEKTVKTTLEIPDSEYNAVYDEVRQRLGGFLAELLQELPISVRRVRDEASPDRAPDTPDEEP